VPRLPFLGREIVAVLQPTWSGPSADPDSTRSAPQVVVSAAADRIERHLRPGEEVHTTPDGRLVLHLRRTDRAARPHRLQELAYRSREELSVIGYPTGLVDLGVGWAAVGRRADRDRARHRAAQAAEESLRQGDLLVRRHEDLTARDRVRISWWSNGMQVVLATAGPVIVPFLAMVALYAVGLDVSNVVYWVLVGALGVTALGIWAECLLALDPPRPPAAPEGRPPRASAVIAAYLPNEADTVVETLRAFLDQQYAGGLQVVLAYNTPRPLPVEAELEAMADTHPDLTVLRVHDSTSKAQNVNAALRVVEGEFVGIFDADHHPMPGAFDRAWQWIADGVDVVQGHCVIRNGAVNGVARLVAVEFEQVYAVSHPGRAALHGFGIFGGSNGYWSADALNRTRLSGSYLTEDIEASMRLIGRGGRIVNDPGLISYELAPESFRQLWKQRMRWAQGWCQVSLRHLGQVLGSDHLDRRQKAGAAYLLGWREFYPWLSLQMLPLLGFLAWRDGGVEWSSPLFALLTLFVTVSGPLQTWVAWRLAAPHVRRHAGWFVTGALASLTFYTEWKNVVARVAHLKQLRGEHQWVVTPRRTGGAHRAPRRTTRPPEEVAA
jgi:hypothetical protein